MELDLGSRFTELFHLPYYNTIRYAIIDPLHNLYLGTAKRLHHDWIEIGLLNNSSFKNVWMILILPAVLDIYQEKYYQDSQTWKNWTIVYSVIALHDILSPEHMACLCQHVLPFAPQLLL